MGMYYQTAVGAFFLFNLQHGSPSGSSSPACFTWWKPHGESLCAAYTDTVAGIKWQTQMMGKCHGIGLYFIDAPLCLCVHLTFSHFNFPSIFRTHWMIWQQPEPHTHLMTVPLYPWSGGGSGLMVSDLDRVVAKFHIMILVRSKPDISL